MPSHPLDFGAVGDNSAGGGRKNPFAKNQKQLAYLKTH
jgi:hypothetical protein